ncbi:MAG: hypothetical protein QNI96_05075 [Woeseiaceae bacterium]|nr:hypothetical protein [Woeseiaceae bacterium]
MPEAYILVNGRPATLVRDDDNDLLDGLDQLRAQYGEDAVEVTGVSEDFARSAPPAPQDFNADLGDGLVPGALEVLGGLGQGAMEGATFGFSDELGAFFNMPDLGGAPARVSDDVRTQLGQTPDEKITNYDILRDEIRGSQNAIREESPWATGGGEFFGALGASAPLFVGGATGQALTRLGPRMAVGAGEGALYGLGMSEGEDALDVGTDTGLGTALGAGFSAVLPPVLRATGRGLRAVSNRFIQEMYETPQQEAERLFRRAIESDGITPAHADELIRQTGGQGMLLDLSEDTAGLAETLAQRPGGTRQILGDAFDQRQVGQQARMADVAEREINQTWPEDYRGLMNSLSRGKADQARPLYDAAYAKPVRMTPDLESMISQVDEPGSYMARAYASAQRLMQADGPAHGSQIQLFDYMGRALSDMADAAYRGGSGNEARIIRNLKRRFDREIYQSVPELQAARNVFAGASQLEDAAELGRGLLTGKRQYMDEVQNEISDFTESQLDAFRIGAVRGIVDRLQDADITHNSARRLLNSTRVRNLLRVAFPDDEAAERFFERVAGEELMHGNRARAMFGSQTARRIAQEEDIAKIGGLAETAADMKAGGGITLLRNFMRWLRGDKELTDEGARVLAEMLTESATPEAVERLSQRGRGLLPAPAYNRDTPYGWPTLAPTIGSMPLVIDESQER